jgi:hypothetical protein
MRNASSPIPENNMVGSSGPLPDFLEETDEADNAEIGANI